MSFIRGLFVHPATSQLRPFWRAQLYLFDQPQAAAYAPQQGFRLLLILAFLELIVRPVFILGAQWLTLSGQLAWPLVQIVLLTGLALWLIIKYAGLSLPQLGLYPWRHWSKTERYYLIQVVLIAIVVFSVVRSASLKLLGARSDLWGSGFLILVTQMSWGFYQELLYRGLLQTELVRRWGMVPGILVSNLIYTFGPLHAYHFWEAQDNPSQLWIFAAIFAIGLLFAIIYRRSGNLWIIGIMHGLGDWFIGGLSQISELAH